MALGEIIILLVVLSAGAPLVGIPRALGQSRRKAISRFAPAVATTTSAVLAGMIAFTVGRGGGVTSMQVIALALNVLWAVLVIRANAKVKGRSPSSGS